MPTFFESVLIGCLLVASVLFWAGATYFVYRYFQSLGQPGPWGDLARAVFCVLLAGGLGLIGYFFKPGIQPPQDSQIDEGVKQQQDQAGKDEL